MASIQFGLRNQIQLLLVVYSGILTENQSWGRSNTLDYGNIRALTFYPCLKSRFRLMEESPGGLLVELLI